MTDNAVVVPQAMPGRASEFVVPPQQGQITMSFGSDAIDGLRMDGQALVISFTEGGELRIPNFQDVGGNGTTVVLADGTPVEPSLLNTALAPSGAGNDDADATHIGIPEEKVVREVNLSPGQSYVLDFTSTEPADAIVESGALIITFENGGMIILRDFESAMTGATPRPSVLRAANPLSPAPTSSP